MSHANGFWDDVHRIKTGGVAPSSMNGMWSFRGKDNGQIRVCGTRRGGTPGAMPVVLIEAIDSGPGQALARLDLSPDDARTLAEVLRGAANASEGGSL